MALRKAEPLWYNGDMKNLVSRMRRLVSYACALVVLGGFCSGEALAISETQMAGISDYCNIIKENLKKVQKSDARTRVYLGGYYEKILSQFVTPLNVRLVENNISDAGLIENQSKMAETKILFVDDYVKYQQGLEELVNMNCKDDAEGFYEKLKSVRKKRSIVEQDVLKMRSLLKRHVELVNELKEKING